MKKLLWISFLSLLIGIYWHGCSEDQNPLPSKSHPVSWLQVSSADFHGKKVLASGTASCTECHGADLQGGASKTSCFACHAQNNVSYPHPQGWRSPESHGQYLHNADWNYADCQSCHGVDALGGESEVSCFKCHDTYPHPSGWGDEENSQFHGEYLEKADWSLAKCQSCHGTDFQGGRIEASCFTCHGDYPHPDGWLDVTSVGFHGQNIRQAHWSMSSCKQCHGEDYKGGTSSISCYQCHQSQAGPEACNVCHGSEANAAPPQDLSGNTATTFIGVGAHQVHYLRFGTCEICHQIPTSFSDPNHIDASPFAEVTSTWRWNRETATCGITCHQDPNKAYIWNNFGVLF